MDRMHGASVCLVIPAFNPTSALDDLLEHVVPAWRGPVVVVDDGSDASCLPIFERAESLGCTVLVHDENKGKGAALRTAFSWVLDNTPETCIGVVTADADGQHTPRDIFAVAHAVALDPSQLILGCRDFSQSDVPQRSRFGNRCMSKAMELFFGMRISDTQTGLRGIPRKLLPVFLNVPGDSYGFETNMLIEARAQRVAFAEVPIATVYENGNASSHFNPVLDSLRIAAIFIRYALSSAASSIIDLVAFAASNAVFAAAGLGVFAVAAATFAARVVSGVANFFINRHVVFKRGGSHAGARYVVLWVACMCASATLVTLLSAVLSFVPTVVVKMVVDTALFFVNYRVQEAWVFAKERSDDNR